MIRYQLRCAAGHGFEGWFPSIKAFDEQAEAKLVMCPECGGRDVGKELMAPAVKSDVPVCTPFTKEAQLRDALRRLRATVEAHCDDVGDRFAQEALRRHDQSFERAERTGRGIYGTMNASEREALEDEGVAFAAIPWIARSDA